MEHSSSDIVDDDQLYESDNHDIRISSDIVAIPQIMEPFNSSSYIVDDDQQSSSDDHVIVSSSALASSSDDHVIVSSSALASILTSLHHPRKVSDTTLGNATHDSINKEEEYINDCLETLSEATVAKLFLYHNKKKYFIYRDTNKIYKFGGVCWNICFDGEMQTDIIEINDLFKKYKNELEHLIKSNVVDGKEENRIISKIDDFLSRKLYNDAFQKNCVKIFKHICPKIEDVEINAYKFCFNNAIYDLNKHIFIEQKDVREDDYSILSAGYDFVNPTTEQIAEVYEIIERILPGIRVVMYKSSHV